MHSFRRFLVNIGHGVTLLSNRRGMALFSAIRGVTLLSNKRRALPVFFFFFILALFIIFGLPGGTPLLPGQQSAANPVQVVRGVGWCLPGNQMQDDTDCRSAQSDGDKSAVEEGNYEQIDRKQNAGAQDVRKLSASEQRDGEQSGRKQGAGEQGAGEQSGRKQRWAGYAHAWQIQAQEMLRFHVRAHSNSPRDQKIKNLVAQGVLAHYRQEWSVCRNSDELGRLIMENKEALEKTAREIMWGYGCAHDVEASLVRAVFPARCYEGRLFPAGEYMALYLIIGEGRGENWWCVLFPPLCFSIVSPLDAGEEGQEQEDGKQENLLASRLADEKSTAIVRDQAVTGKKSSQKGQKKDSVALVEQEKPSHRWRFWLWDVMTKKRRR